MTHPYTIQRPEYLSNRLGFKSKKYHFSELRSKRATEFDELSRKSLEKLESKYPRSSRPAVLHDPLLHMKIKVC